MEYEDFTEFVGACRKWREENKDWELICDMENSENVYESFDELPKRRKNALEVLYRDHAEYCYNEFETAFCKVEFGFLNKTLEIRDEFPQGHGMMIFKTKGKKF